ncbi:hypothetical protein BGZ76_003415, partial [Entomortierella beljakovae]
MSDASDQITLLQAQLAAVSAKLEELSKNTEHNPYLVPKEPLLEITPDDAIIEVYPAINAKNFFLKVSSDTKTNAEYSSNLTKEMHSFPKNTTQPYTAPKSTTVAWPESAKQQAAMDKLISRYQVHLANLTRPLDAFATE